MVQAAVVAESDQTIDLSCDPDTTWFKKQFKKTTALGFYIMCQEAKSNVALGRKVNFEIEYGGSLIHRAWLRTQWDAVVPNGGLLANAFPNAAHYTQSLGHAVIKSYCLQIGSTEFTEQSREFMYMWDQIAYSNELRQREEVGFSETQQGLIDYGRKAQTLYTALPTFNHRNVFNAIPITALGKSYVKYEFNLAPESELYCETGDKIGATSLSTGGFFRGADMLVEHIFLTPEEDALMRESGHKYVYVQENMHSPESHSSTQTSQRLRADYHHPTVELLVAARRTAVVSPTPAEQLAGVCPNQWFNFSGVPDSLDGGVTFDQPTDPFTTLQFCLGGQDLTEELEAPWYRLVNPARHHTSKPNGFIYNKSFALYPENESCHSGYLNNSRFRDFSIKFAFPQLLEIENTDPAVWDGEIFHFQRHYQLMEIGCGTAGRVWAN